MQDPLAISLFAQKIFNHELLFALVESGALKKDRASQVAAKTAEFLRDMNNPNQGTPFSEKLADGYEGIAAAMLGLPRISGEKAD
jgi:hypothetical protein